MRSYEFKYETYFARKTVVAGLSMSSLSIQGKGYLEPTGRRRVGSKNTRGHAIRNGPIPSQMQYLKRPSEISSSRLRQKRPRLSARVRIPRTPLPSSFPLKPRSLLFSRLNPLVSGQAETELRAGDLFG